MIHVLDVLNVFVACPCDVLEMVAWDGCKAGQIASAPRTEDCIGCKRCETACPTDFLSVLTGGETTRSMGLAANSA